MKLAAGASAFTRSLIWDHLKRELQWTKTKSPVKLRINSGSEPFTST